MQQPNSTKGFFTIVQNNDKVDYIRLAYGLALSLKKSQKKFHNLSIGITPGTTVPKNYQWAFDKIIEMPWGDDAQNAEWKLQNEWKSYWMTPYDETIKLDADMLFFSDIECWWEYFSASNKDYIFTNGILNWRSEQITDDYYRKVFTKNALPNIYSALFYFKKTNKSAELFTLSKMIYWNWESFFEAFLDLNFRPTYPSTDVVFALALKILDIDQSSYTTSMYPTFTHMKTMLQGWNYNNLQEDWRTHIETFFTDACECKVGNHRQLYPLHYHIKDWLTDKIIRTYEEQVKDA